ncbi:MAG: lysophospholipase [Cellvibrionaceae bacterium]|nr:lysophospholipase [Cellvibrionaceae bacterium]
MPTATGTLEGSLLLGADGSEKIMALIIAGSGPTDRDGNNPVMRNNSLKMLAEGLAARGIASLRYDKRGVSRSAAAGAREQDLRFDHYWQDAAAWLALLRQRPGVETLIVIGHSEGSLLGMLAAQRQPVDLFISLAGGGQSADKILLRQLSVQAPHLIADAEQAIAKIKQGSPVSPKGEVLSNLFRPSVQPFLASWFRYDPALELAKLRVPVLLVQGETDVQVSVADALALQRAKPNAKLVVLKGMNHILKPAPPNYRDNIKTYRMASLPLASGLIDSLHAFINDNK